MKAENTFTIKFILPRKNSPILTLSTNFTSLYVVAGDRHLWPQQLLEDTTIFRLSGVNFDLIYFIF